MLFHSSIRRELARSFGATLLVLLTVSVTILLVRTLGLANKGNINPQEIMLALGYTALGQMPVILTLTLFICIVSTLSRMHRDSEMVIWFASGRGLASLLGPVMRFSWPVLLAIALLTTLVWPWSHEQTGVLRDRFQKRGDLERVEPGQFQESANGRRVFFIDKDTADGKEGRNIFISSVEPDGSESITSARGGRIEWVGDTQYLVLESGQRLDIAPGQAGVKVSVFEQYATQIGAARAGELSQAPLRATPTWTLLSERSAAHLGELGWRIGMALTAFNFVLIGLALSAGNPRVGRSGHLAFALFAFVFYYNLLNLGQTWVANGMVGLGGLLLALHGGVFMVAVAWIAKRHHQWTWRDLRIGRTQGAQTP